MLIPVLSKINELNESMFQPLDNLLEKIPVPDWALDAIIDSVHLLPFLFFVFLFIEILEYYYADKISDCLKKTGKSGIIIGSLASIFPQCGFSVIAAGLYTKRIITLGCLIAVFLATSDETIPILLATPEKIHLIVPIVLIKLFIGIVSGFIIDAVFHPTVNTQEEEIVIEEGCCKHDIENASKREIFIHPIFHTFNIFWFILVITLIINFCLENVSVESVLFGNKFIQPVISAFVGLIPNCAISIGFTMMLIKGTITLGTAMSGLLSNAGLGLLVLLKNNDFKDTLKIILILLTISILSGILINSLNFI